MKEGYSSISNNEDQIAGLEISDIFLISEKNEKNIEISFAWETVV